MDTTDHDGEETDNIETMVRTKQRIDLEKKYNE
jgi:hypothetical protein